MQRLLNPKHLHRLRRRRLHLQSSTGRCILQSPPQDLLKSKLSGIYSKFTSSRQRFLIWAAGLGGIGLVGTVVISQVFRSVPSIVSGVADSGDKSAVERLEPALRINLNHLTIQQPLVSQCNQLAEVVNQTQGFMQDFETEIQSFSNNAAAVQNITDIKDAATQYTEAGNTVVASLNGLSSNLETTDLSDESLVMFRDNYVEVVQGFSSALNQASDAMELVKTVESEAALPARIEESQEKTMEAVSSIEELSVTESTIINNLNTYCGVEPIFNSDT